MLLAACSGERALELEVPRWRAEMPGASGPVEVTLPAHFDLPRHDAAYVLRAEVAVPEAMRGKPLTLAIGHMPAVATLVVDGALAVPIDANPSDTRRASSPNRWRIAEDASKDGKLSFELTVLHRTARSAWIDAVPLVTTDPLGGRLVANVHAFNVAAASGSLAAAVVVAVLYGFLFAAVREPKRRAAYGWFVLGATCGMAYPAFVLGLTQPIFGIWEPGFLTLSLAFGSIAALHFSRAYADVPPPSRLWWIVLALVLVLVVLTRDPFVSVLVTGPLILVLTVAQIAVQVLFLARMKRDGRTIGKNLAGVAFAWPFAVILGTPDLFAWIGRGEPSFGIRTACVGIMFLSLYQAWALSRDHIVSLRRADELVLELEDRVKKLSAKHREIELLNDELRRQIAARSRELAEKLAMMNDEMTLDPPELHAGDMVDGRYRVVKQLGAGGMGAVYEVERTSDGGHFALKALSMAGDAATRARFAREAQIVAEVNHPNVVSIVDVDVSKEGFLFLVMELVSGGTTLHDVRRRHNDVPWTLGVLAQVAAGIDAIHAQGIIHRDLKPGNILLSRGSDGRRPNVKITDFGISTLQGEGSISSASLIARPITDSLPPAEEVDEAPTLLRGGRPAHDPLAPTVALDLRARPKPAAAVGDDARTLALPPRSEDESRPLPRTPNRPLTQTGIIFGTPQYMAQELTSGTKNATRSSDIFSLGMIAFELLTAKRPFVEAPVSAKLNGRTPVPAPPFKLMVSELPDAVAELLDRAISHDPKVRPSAKELATVLREASGAPPG